MTLERTKKETTKRYILFILSLFFAALGVAITKKGELGVSPVSSTANILSLKYTTLSLGNWLIIWNCILIVGQILILRKKFEWIQLLQIPLSFIFGYFTDFGMWIVAAIEVNTYMMRILMISLGTVVVGFGVSLAVIADVVMNSGEAFVKAISDTINKEFGNIKVIFDVACVTLAIVLSLIFFDFSIQGTREGTIIAALCTGWIVKYFCKLLKSPLTKVLQA
ncbi:YczE/YyaS/YitT family protein [Cellulosilyticum ruminicola]|uniref:YczE/YyaS/YitT family protein n=1 Tax=Cellulosilyticum ruminicola TaxID=425254 RepID=UPI0006D06804|nr:DUF6198 family protein [Cellulosilyticum ruminicola]